jgi:hypothetical protein
MVGAWARAEALGSTRLLAKAMLRRQDDSSRCTVVFLSKIVGSGSHAAPGGLDTGMHNLGGGHHGATAGKSRFRNRRWNADSGAGQASATWHPNADRAAANE